MTTLGSNSFSSSNSDRQLATLIDLAHIFNSSLNLKVVLNRVMERTKSVMQAEASSLLILDKETGDLQWASATGEVGELVMRTVSHPKSSGIAGWVVDSKQPLLIEDAYDDPRFDPTMDKKTGFRTRSILCVPLVVHDEAIGVAQVINRIGDGAEGVFDPNDLEFFSRICLSAAIAIQNALLHEEMIRQERQQRDLELAKAIQQSFLPDPPEGLSGFQVSMRNRSALKVGGDFYEFFRIAPETYFFCIGDVSGKGVPAALYMARLISDLRYTAPEYKDTGEIFSRLNNRLCDETFSSVFVTLLGGVLNVRENSLTLASAGHPHPILVCADGPACFLEVPGQPPLGLVKDLTFEQKPFRLAPGESLFLFTDGFIEATNAKREMIDLSGLLSFFSGVEERGDRLLDLVFQKILHHLEGDTTQDDLTALLIDSLPDD
jgi:phosphoserine phosphatase RsbU/P